MADATPTPLVLDTETNSYVELDDAATFFTSRVDAALWDAYSDEQQTAALVQAYGAINRLRYNGSKTGANTQRAAFPRVGLVDLDGYPLASDAVPQDVKDAQCLEALARLQSANAQSSQRAQLQAQGVTEFQLGDLHEIYDLTKTAGKTVLSPEAFALLKPYLLTAGGTTAGWPFTR